MGAPAPPAAPPGDGIVSMDAIPLFNEQAQQVVYEQNNEQSYFQL